MRITIASLILALTPQLFAAGGWTSGGGELIRDTHNPWYMSNTVDVKYCVQIDEKAFGQSETFVRDQVSKAIEFWKLQLKDLTYWKSNSGFSYELGTQTFIAVSCSQNPDITFQFATLSEAQKLRLGDLSKTVAVSVRTDYDLKNLKAKGFVFVQVNDQFAVKPWSRNLGSRVLPVLIHELGHIFGIQHSKEIQFMNEDFAEDLVAEKNANSIDLWTDFISQNENYKKIHLFSYAPELMQIISCLQIIDYPIKLPKPIIAASSPPAVINTFFGIPPEDQCKSITYRNNELVVESGIKKPTLLGKAKLIQKDLSGFFDKYDGTTAVHFWCPPEQQVFDAAEYEVASKTKVGSFQPRQYFKGTYQSIDGKLSRPIGVEVSNGGWISKITGFMNGEVIIDLQRGF